LKIDLIKFFKSADKVYPFNGEISPDAFDSKNDEFQIIEPIGYSGAIYKVDGSYIINADIQYKYETKCARCFKNTVNEVNTSFSAKLEENHKPTEEEEDDDIIYYEEGILYLDKYILLEVTSSLPMKTLCDENCKGLCDKCGADLNKERCNCEDDYIDPRLEKLKDFFLDE